MKRWISIRAQNAAVICIGGLHLITSGFSKRNHSELFRNCKKRCFVPKLGMATSLLAGEEGTRLFGNAPWKAAQKLKKGSYLRRAYGRYQRNEDDHLSDHLGGGFDDALPQQIVNCLIAATACAASPSGPLQFDRCGSRPRPRRCVRLTRQISPNHQETGFGLFCLSSMKATRPVLISVLEMTCVTPYFFASLSSSRDGKSVQIRMRVVGRAL